jgi:hypothetical protein
MPAHAVKPKDVQSSLARRTVAECLGTAFLLAAVVGSGIMAQKLAGGNNALALLATKLGKPASKLLRCTPDVRFGSLAAARPG